jgi:hypothetical protein
MELFGDLHRFHDPDIAGKQGIQPSPENVGGESFCGQSKMHHLTESIHPRIGPSAPDHGHGMVRHFRQGRLDRLLDTRGKVGTLSLGFLSLPAAIVPTDIRDPERVFHDQISNRNPA